MADQNLRSQDYEELCKRLKELSTLEGVNGLLMWDEMVRSLDLAD